MTPADSVVPSVKQEDQKPSLPPWVGPGLLPRLPRGGQLRGRALLWGALASRGAGSAGRDPGSSPAGKAQPSAGRQPPPNLRDYPAPDVSTLT